MPASEAADPGFQFSETGRNIERAIAGHPIGTLATVSRDPQAVLEGSESIVLGLRRQSLRVAVNIPVSQIHYMTTDEVISSEMAVTDGRGR